jgi:hypothetical protein
MSKKYRKRSTKEWAAIHAKRSSSSITLNDVRPTQPKIVGRTHTTNIPTRYYTNAERLRQQRITNIKHQQESLRRQLLVKKLIPDTVEASASVGIFGIKATWHPKE